MVADHLLACRADWYELGVDLRNRIVVSYRRMVRLGGRGGKTEYRKAMVEAFQTWDPPAPPPLRCHSCKTRTLFIEVLDNGDERPICLLHAKAALSGSGAVVLVCSRCGSEVPFLVSLSSRPPHLCVDCLRPAA